MNYEWTNQLAGELSPAGPKKEKPDWAEINSQINRWEETKNKNYILIRR